MAADRVVFELVRFSLLGVVVAGEPGFEAVDPCPVAVVRVACSLEHLVASPLHVAWSRRSRLRLLPLAYICDPLALVSELIALLSDHLTLVGHAVSFVGAMRSLLEEAAQPRSAHGVGRGRFRVTITFRHGSAVGVCPGA